MLHFKYFYSNVTLDYFEIPLTGIQNFLVYILFSFLNRGQVVAKDLTFKIIVKEIVHWGTRLGCRLLLDMMLCEKISGTATIQCDTLPQV